MDDTGLTGTQKITLLSAWGLIKQEYDLHGRNIMLLLFREHPDFIPYFDFSSDPVGSNMAENQTFHAHAINVILTLGGLIETALKDPGAFQATLTKLVAAHRSRRVTAEDFRLLGDIIVGYVVEVLGPQAANSLPDAMCKLMERFAEAFDF